MSESGTAGLFETRLDGIPRALSETLRGELPAPLLGEDWVITTGIGCSEGPARLLAAVLQEAGRPAHFLPLSAFYLRPAAGLASRRATLVLFSQGLSPNARLALDHGDSFARQLIVTSALESEPLAGRQFLRHPPASEAGMLVRLVGPACASLVALRLAGFPEASLQALPERYAAASRAEAVPIDPSLPTLLVGAGGTEAQLHAFRNKWLESLPGPLPQASDVLAVAHGPLQALSGQSANVVSFEHDGSDRAPDDVETGLFERLASVAASLSLAPRRLLARLPAPLSFFEHDAALGRLIANTLRNWPRDTAAQCDSDIDKPLYELAGCPCPDCRDLTPVASASPAPAAR